MSKRVPFVAGNWKMNTTESEAIALASEVVASVVGMAVDVAVCVPFPHLSAVRAATRGSTVGVGAQDVHWEARGAYTGEVSVEALEDYCRYVIIGHSERRQYFGETDQSVQQKLAVVLASNLDPIMCIGETLDERRSGRVESVLERQLHGGLFGLEVSSRLTVAYEPVWAIGTGETATPADAQSACEYIRGVLSELSGDEAGRIRIQYGGSMNPGNAAELLACSDVDGGLIGGASLKADQFAAVVGAAAS
ncbi:MAG TPA: triose-phosphate isomerase [Dehalococcoidia bacterium]|nr:triose-phosphate isomerase [Dehalococcoidia bacterium]